MNTIGSTTQCILNLTRCCTQNCDFCAVDAIFCRSVRDCASRSRQEQNAGREMTPQQWCNVVERILAFDPNTEFDLSGGDCLALPWVAETLIPFILSRVHSRDQVSVTSTADSIRLWLNILGQSPELLRPRAVHITYDGCRQYSFDNMAIVPNLQRLGVDVHAECPITRENCEQEVVKSIYAVVKESQIKELLLMGFFPVGRGQNRAGVNGLEPSPEQYRKAIAQFLNLRNQDADGPKVKVQCTLKGYMPGSDGRTPCKMGKRTWCVMPNGCLLTCPWAYSTGGRPLSREFAAGNLLRENIADCLSTASDLRHSLWRKFSGKCLVKAFVGEQILGTPTPLAAVI